MNWSRLCFIIGLGIAVLNSEGVGAQTNPELPHRWTLDVGTVQNSGRQTTLGDLDGDSREDFALEIPGVGFRVLSGRTGTLLYQINNPDGASAFFFGRITANIGDVNGDGKDDLAVGSPFAGQGGRVYIYSGINGALITTISSLFADELVGQSVAKVGDLTGDGVNEIVFTAPGYNPNGAFQAPGALIVFDLVQHLPVYAFPGPGGNPYNFVLDLGDLNGDGVPDFGAATGATFFLPSGSFYVFSGSDAAVLRVSSLGSHFVNGAGSQRDVNGDGVPDYVLALQVPAVHATPLTHVRIYDGAAGTFTTIEQSPSTQVSANQLVGWDADFADDTNGDGVCDVVVGAPFSSEALGGQVRIYDGVTQQIVASFSSADPAASFGWNVSRAGDIDGDGFADVYFDERTFNQSTPATTYKLHAASAAGTRRVSLSPLNTETLELTWTSLPTLIPSLGIIEVTGAQPFANGAWVFGTDRMDTTMFGVRIYVDLTPGLFLVDGFSFGPAGRAVFASNLNLPALAGQNFFFQCFEVAASAPFGILSSNALELLFSN